jgi:glycosyltransferase involved in cell wall biosynthesis
VPVTLLRHAVNCGLGRTRNALVERARGEYVFMLDADNEIYPATLGRLVDALDADPDAMFAYPILATFESGEPADLLSAQAWDPEMLRNENYIDATALIRRQDLQDIRGYAEDPRLVGWEDYDLWCRVAESGRHGVHVPEILAGYRANEHSMIGLTNLDVTVARSLVAARAPTVFRPGGRAEPTVR